MVDPVTTVGAGLTVLGSKEILTKLLGPTADYIGSELKGLVEKCNVNLDRVFRKAENKLGEKIDEPGVVNPRVLKHVIDEGRFCDDELTSEYYGGILASSRCENGRDDRGVYFLSTIRGLSVYQLRTHYLIYSLINNKFTGTGYNIGLGDDCSKMRLYVPINVYLAAMEFSSNENAGAILVHSIIGLSKHGLLENYSYGTKEHLQKEFADATAPGFIFSPSIAGAELFVWATGRNGATGHEIINEELNANFPEVKIIDGALPLVKIENKS